MMPRVLNCHFSFNVIEQVKFYYKVSTSPRSLNCSSDINLSRDRLLNQAQTDLVHEGVRDDSGNRTQEVDIYYRFVGMID